MRLSLILSVHYFSSDLGYRVAIVLSISSLLTAAVHHPESLRGLSRWTLSFIINGPNTGFWKRKLGDPSVPPTPSTLVDHSQDPTPTAGLSRPHTPNLVVHLRDSTSKA